MASMNISLPDPMRAFVQRRIDSGRYASVSDYVRDLIRRDQGRTEEDEQWLRDLGASIDRGLAEAEAGQAHDMDAVFDELDRTLAAMIADRPRA